MNNPEISALFEELNDDRKTLSNFNKMKKEENLVRKTSMRKADFKTCTKKYKV